MSITLKPLFENVRVYEKLKRYLYFVFHNISDLHQFFCQTYYFVF